MCDLQPLPVRQLKGNSACCVDGLSDEILLQIFSHIPPKLLSTLSKVCLRWKRLCSDFNLYRRLVFQGPDPDTSIVVDMIRGAPWLRSLELNGRWDADNILCNLAECCPLLEKLVIIQCQGSSENVEVSSEHLRQVMTGCTKLQSLSFEGTSFTDEEVYEEIGSKLPSLTAINIDDITNTNETLMGIANNCVRVEEVRMKSLDSIDEEVIQTLCENFSESLRILELDHFPGWTDSAVQSLPKCQKLENVHLRNLNGLITEVGLKCIGLMPNIKQVELQTFESTSPKFWVNLLRSPNMSNLKVLNMSRCNVNDDVLSAISVLPNIEKLALRGRSCKFTDKGLLSIGDIPKLVELFLEPCNNVTPVGWKTFVQKPYTKNIKHMTMHECTYLDDSVARLIMKHLLSLKVLTLENCSRLSDEMMYTFMERMLLRGCDCRAFN